jgi:hypothetical protein
MQKWITPHTEAEVCRMFIGLYVLICPLAFLVALGALVFFGPSLWQSATSDIRGVLTQRSVPIFSPEVLRAWTGISLSMFSGLLFFQYCFRLWKRPGLLPGSSLWKWTAFQMLAVLWWLPGVARVIAICPLWPAYFIMTLMAWKAAAAQDQHSEMAPKSARYS